MEIRVAPEATAAADEAAAWLARRLRDAVRRRGVATLAASGGGTPVAMYAELAQLDLPWAHVHVWQVDERVAPDGDPARNAGMVAALPLPKSHIHLMPVTARHLQAACGRYAKSLPQQFDVVHLGLGDDGHTASWPPGDPVIDRPEPVAASALYNGFVRMTLTPPVVNAARSRLVLIAGASKAAPVRKWLLGDTAVPVQRVRRTGTVVVLDAAAAAGLPTPAAHPSR
ncbi:MAG: 6-phosphogluconolactonase [Actinomycetota bacterium]|nr:6-phosphogluconolactonase [Actinomycetota bacterium]